MGGANQHQNTECNTRKNTTAEDLFGTGAAGEPS
jgi:hypothetical protein